MVNETNAVEVQEATADVQPEEGSSETNSETQTAAVALVEDDGRKLIPVKKGKQLLRQLELAISKGIKDFWSVGEALIEIRDQQLFKLRYSGEDYRTFGDYLEDRWGYSRGYQIIKAAQVRRTMIELGIKNPDNVCTSERQYRENADLLKVAAEPEKLEMLKESIKAERKLSNEILGREIRKLLPEVPQKRERPASEKALDRRLAKLEAKLRQELEALKARHPSSHAKIDEWLKALGSL